MIDYSSNDYLGLADHPEIIATASRCLRRFGLGARAARVLSGNYSLHEAVERELASIKGAEASLLFNSGYVANLGALQALAGRHDVIYSDELNHASIIDGGRLSRAVVRTFPHADVHALERLLAEDRGRYQGRLVVVEGVYSMDGDVFPLQDLVGVCRRYDAISYVDDAHGTGVIGSGGAGSAHHCGVHGQIDVTVGTLGKALGVVGAFVAGSEQLRRLLISRARSFLYTTATPPAFAAAVAAALEVSAREGWRRERLWENVTHLLEGLTELGLAPSKEVPGHIVPIVIGDVDQTTRIAKALLNRGYLLGAIRPPTVPVGSARLRITVSTDHTSDQIDGLLAALRELMVDFKDAAD